MTITHHAEISRREEEARPASRYGWHDGSEEEKEGHKGEFLKRMHSTTGGGSFGNV